MVDWSKKVESVIEIGPKAGLGDSLSKAFHSDQKSVYVRGSQNCEA